jgi:hypothetical protein
MNDLLDSPKQRVPLSVWPFVGFGCSRYKELLSKLSLWS